MSILRPAIISENGLGSDNSIPHEWFEQFLPRLFTSQWTSYPTNKSLLANTDQDLDIKHFSNNELNKHITVYMVHRLAPLPHVSMKFVS